MKGFTVNAQWIEYAHGPGADDGQPLATQLVNLPVNKKGAMTITDRSLVDEVRDVAELYLGDTAVQEDERLWFRMYPFALVKRAKQWLKDNP